MSKYKNDWLGAPDNLINIWLLYLLLMYKLKRTNLLGVSTKCGVIYHRNYVIILLT